MSIVSLDLVYWSRVNDLSEEIVYDSVECDNIDGKLYSMEKRILIFIARTVECVIYNITKQIHNRIRNHERTCTERDTGHPGRIC